MRGCCQPRGGSSRALWPPRWNALLLLFCRFFTSYLCVGPLSHCVWWEMTDVVKTSQDCSSLSFVLHLQRVGNFTAVASRKSRGRMVCRLLFAVGARSFQSLKELFLGSVACAGLYRVTGLQACSSNDRNWARHPAAGTTGFRQKWLLSSWVAAHLSVVCADNQQLLSCARAACAAWAQGPFSLGVLLGLVTPKPPRLCLPCWWWQLLEHPFVQHVPYTCAPGCFLLLGEVELHILPNHAPLPSHLDFLESL